MGISFTQSTITVDSDLTLEAGSLAEANILLELKDSTGAPYGASHPTVEFFATKGTITHIQDSGGVDSATVISWQNGEYMGFYMADSGVGQSIITAKVNGTLIEDNAIITLVPGTPDYKASDIEADPSTIQYQFNENSTITLTVVDSSGYPITDGGHAVSFTADPAGRFTNVIDNEDGTYTAYFSAQFEGDYKISAKVDTVDVNEIITISVKEEAASMENPVNGFRLPPGSGGAGGLPISLMGLSKLPYANWPNTRAARSLLREPLNRNGFNMAALMQQGIIGPLMPFAGNITGLIPGKKSMPISASSPSIGGGSSSLTGIEGK